MSNPTTSTISIAATADDVRAVLFDIANYPTWSTSFKSATVIESDAQGRPTQVKLSVDAGALKDKPTLNYDWSGYPDRVDFSLEDADLLTDMTGAYIVKDNGDETEVTFELTVALSMPVPEMMRTKAEKATIDLALKQLKEKLEN
ncbi:MAG: polyketide cyclase / dehydrase and lipid transport [Actinobacteria bacterium]|nr:polyketide cyclase / dehydrase and lipid transport [Actinomycetota bacterium]